ncbi:PAS domain-containing protein, partial [Halomonas sp. BC04]|uniref:PAS domain-containing protein n=1 Tax=Halomonas sp. BC04 TaxID=1403540 RepID=UPI000686C315
LNQHAIVSVADRAGIITYVNDLFCDISGYSRTELLGKNHRILKSGQHPDSYYQEIWTTIVSGQPWFGELCNRRKDGSFYWVESTIIPFLDETGKPYQYVSIRTDISHVKATEQALAASADRLNATLESTKDGILAVAADGQVLFMNRQFRQMWNLPEHLVSEGDDEQLLAHALTQLLDPQAFMQKVTALYQSTEESDDLIGLLDGRVFERHAKPLRRDGKSVGRVWSFHDITERLSAERAAEGAKERLRRGQLYANIGTWEWNIVTGELFWTERIAPLFGYPAGDLETCYENFLAAVHPDDRQAVIDAVAACVESDAPYDIEHRVMWPDGTVRWLLERGAVTRNAEGNPLTMIGVVQDIDDRKRAELAVMEREQQLYRAQQLAQLGNWTADLVSGELYWSDVIYEIFGYVPGEVIPSVELFQQAIHPEDTELVEQSEQRAREGGLHDVVHRIVRPNGDIRYVHELASAELDTKGQVLRLQGTVQDVTALKQAEQSLLIFRRVFDTTEQGIGVADAEGFLLYSNPAHDHLLGCQPAECQGRHFTQFLPEEVMQWAPEAIMGAVSKGETWTGLLPLKRKDGTELVSIANVGSIAGTDGHPQYLFIIMSDYTSELRRQQQLANAKEEAERANQAKSSFLSSMSHELRTPMNAILGFAQILEYDDALDADQQDNVHEIIKAGHHLLELINEVLDLSKVESGQLELLLEPVEVCPVVEECLSLIQPLAQKREIRIQHSGLEQSWVRADRTRLKQVLLNLLSNAVKYNREGGQIKLSLFIHEQDRLRILVSDTGKGMSREQLDSLFQPFNRLNAEGSAVEGTGIGLTITRRIMEMMGGSVDVQSEVGVGSTFWLELPLESRGEKVGTSAQHDEEEGEIRLIPTDQQHLVLYIEDNPANLKLVASLLGRLSRIHLLTAHLPELGLELARTHKPALILLDINMPGMDGYQVLQILKQDAELNEIPVLAVTANAIPRDIVRGMSAGFSDYITKPIKVASFLDSIHHWLGQKSNPKA